MLGHWYQLLFTDETPVKKISAHGVEKQDKPKRGKFEVNSFSGFPEKLRRKDDDEFILLMMMGG